MSENVSLDANAPRPLVIMRKEVLKYLKSPLFLNMKFDFMKSFVVKEIYNTLNERDCVCKLTVPQYGCDPRVISVP